MENALPASSGAPSNFTWPDEASLAAFRAWLQGVPSRAAVDRYLPDRRTAGESSRSVIGRVKRQLVAFATGRAQAGLAATLSAASPFDRKLVKAGPAAIETLRGMPPPQPRLGDAVERWLPVRLVGASPQPLGPTGATRSRRDANPRFTPWPITGQRRRAERHHGERLAAPP